MIYYMKNRTLGMMISSLRKKAAWHIFDISVDELMQIRTELDVNSGLSMLEPS